MSTTQQTDSDMDSTASAIDILHRKIMELGGQAEARARAGRRKTRIFLGLGVVLITLLMISLSGLTLQIRRLDTASLAQMGRIEVQKRMPGGREIMEDYLEREAPRLVGGAVAGILELLPEIRKIVAKGLNERLELITAEFEKRTLNKLSNVVYKSKLDIDLAWPNDSDRVKLQKLIDTVANDFSKVFATAINELYPDYASEMKQIKFYLQELGEKDPGSLSKEDRLRRGIIETMILLSRREMSGH